MRDRRSRVTWQPGGELRVRLFTTYFASLGTPLCSHMKPPLPAKLRSNRILRSFGL